MKIKFLKKFFWITLILFHFNSKAQIIQRTELPFDSYQSGIEAIPLGSNGVLLISNPSKSTFQVQKLDSNFEQLWTIDGPVESGLSYTTSSYDGHAVYLLFSKHRGTQYQIVKVNVGPGFVETFQVTAVDRFEITDFKALGYGSFMSGTVRNQSVLLFSQLNTGQTRVLPPPTNEQNVIQSIAVDTTHALVNITFALNKAKKSQIITQSFEESGKLYKQLSTQTDKNLSLLNGKMQILNDSTQFLFGTYGYRDMQSAHSAFSQGLYMTKFVNNKIVFKKYYSFTEFDNFFNFMSDRQREKFKKQLNRKKDAGEDLKLNYRLLIHDIIQTGDRLSLVAEVFVPEYKTHRHNRINAYGYRYKNIAMSPYRLGIYNPYLWNPLYGGNSHHEQLFNGFKYTHAIVANFDQSGKLLWDNSINFDGIKRMELTESIKVKSDSEGITKLVYNTNGTIRAKSIQSNNQVDFDRTLKSATLSKADIIKKTELNEVDFWYDDYFISWGEQQIVNQSDSEQKGRRKVFYLNKVKF